MRALIENTGPQRRIAIELDSGLITALCAARRPSATLSLDRLVNDILSAAVDGDIVAAILEN